MQNRVIFCIKSRMNSSDFQLRIRKGPSTNTEIVGMMYNGAQWTIKGESGNFYKISYNGITGYASKDYIRVQDTPIVTVGGAKIYDTACRKLGCQYVYGGTGPNVFDCSGLVQWAHAQCGIKIVRVAQEQAKGGRKGSGANSFILSFPIDYANPMNGLIKYLRDNNKMQNISATTSSANIAASKLFEQSTSNVFQLGSSHSNYFEIQFLNNSYMILEGYGFLARPTNCNAPRNCNVSCMSTNPETLSANEVNNDSLCTEGKPCSSTCKVTYETIPNKVKCTNISFSVTGRTLCNNGYQWTISGIELFGSYNIKQSLKRKGLSCRCYKRVFFKEYFIVPAHIKHIKITQLILLSSILFPRKKQKRYIQ